MFVISTCTFSQNLSRDVIAAQGDFDQNENMTLEWTLGDAFIETVASTDNIFTQGFQQSFLMTVARLDTKDIENNPFNIVLYPNPVDAFLHVYVKSPNRTGLNISLYDVTGKFIKQESALETDKDITLNFSFLTSGIYILKIIDSESTAAIKFVVK